MQHRNPLNADGKSLTCHICRSIAHFAPDCPHRSEKQQGSEDNQHQDSSTNRSWVASVKSDVIECQASDVSMAGGVAFNYMILDTGCPQNVA